MGAGDIAVSGQEYPKDAEVKMIRTGIGTGYLVRQAEPGQDVPH